MKKKVIVACGGAVATSTVAGNKIVELARERALTWNSASAEFPKSPPTCQQT